MLHEDDHRLGALDKVHRPAHAPDLLTRDRPVRQITVLTDLQGPQNRLVDMATTDHGETRGGTEGGSAGQDGDGVFTCVDDVRVKLIVVRCRAHLHDSVFTLEGDPGSSGDEIRDPGGQTDAEVDVF